MKTNNKVKLWLLKKLLEKKAPPRDPLSGVDAKNNDYYRVCILSEDKEEKYLLKEIDFTQNVLNVKEPDQNKNYTVEKTLEIGEEALKAHFKVTHYYKNLRKIYENLYSVLFSYITSF